MSERIVIAGRGHIGEYVERSLRADGYDVDAYDVADGYDLSDDVVARPVLLGARVLIDTLPYYHNPLLAQIAAEFGVAYFNLSEDVDNTAMIRRLHNTKAPLVPQCGLAPGMVSIIAQEMTRAFQSVDSIRIRVGALPQTKFNHLGYALTWNPAGLINEYCNPCIVVQHGKVTTVTPLDGAETLVLSDTTYEAAYTSGGIGTLAETWAGRANHVDYKTLRYPGHFDVMRVLRDDLKLADHKREAEAWFTSALPRTTEDVVVIGIQVVGSEHGVSPTTKTTRTYSRNIYPTIDATAIQIATAHGVLAVVDAYLRGYIVSTGCVKQEDIPFDAIRSSRYSAPYELDVCLP